MSIRWERNEFRSTTCAAVEIRSRLGGRSVAAEPSPSRPVPRRQQGRKFGSNLPAGLRCRSCRGRRSCRCRCFSNRRCRRGLSGLLGLVLRRLEGLARLVPAVAVSARPAASELARPLCPPPLQPERQRLVARWRHQVPFGAGAATGLAAFRRPGPGRLVQPALKLVEQRVPGRRLVAALAVTVPSVLGARRQRLVASAHEPQTAVAAEAGRIAREVGVHAGAHGHRVIGNARRAVWGAAGRSIGIGLGGQSQSHEEGGGRQTEPLHLRFLHKKRGCENEHTEQRTQAKGTERSICGRRDGGVASARCAPRQT